LNSTERVVVPLLLVQTASVILLWSLDTLAVVDQKIFALFLGADFLAFGLMAHLYLNMKTDSETNGTTLMVWGLVIAALFVAGLIVS
jgi:FtsH-binding integral membrane protein